MSILTSITPTNLHEEKEKFFADTTYNPQFTYTEKILPEDLKKYGEPNEANLAIAKTVLQKTFTKYTPAQLKSIQGKILTESEVKQHIATFLRLHKLDHRISVSYSASYVSRTSVSPSSLKIRIPMQYRVHNLQGMLYHEIGTHVLRRVNYEKQPWFKKKQQLGLTEYLETEEGLASLHSRIPHPYKAAVPQSLQYYATWLAQHLSFRDVWKEIHPYSESEDRCWSLTVRAKRGLADTSQPGGYTKDILYLDGMIRVWKWLRERDFDCTQLYFGKIAMQDVDKIITLNPEFKPELPIFFTSDPSLYRSNLEAIGLENNFDR